MNRNDSNVNVALPNDFDASTKRCELSIVKLTSVCGVTASELSLMYCVAASTSSIKYGI